MAINKVVRAALKAISYKDIDIKKKLCTSQEFS